MQSLLTGPVNCAKKKIRKAVRHTVILKIPIGVLYEIKKNLYFETTCVRLSIVRYLVLAANSLADFCETQYMELFTEFVGTKTTFVKIGRSDSSLYQGA